MQTLGCRYLEKVYGHSSLTHALCYSSKGVHFGVFCYKLYTIGSVHAYECSHNPVLLMSAMRLPVKQDLLSLSSTQVHLHACRWVHGLVHLCKLVAIAIAT